MCVCVCVCKHCHINKECNKQFHYNIILELNWNINSGKEGHLIIINP